MGISCILVHNKTKWFISGCSYVSLALNHIASHKWKQLYDMHKSIAVEVQNVSSIYSHTFINLAVVHCIGRQIPKIPFTITR